MFTKNFSQIKSKPENKFKKKTKQIKKLFISSDEDENEIEDIIEFAKHMDNLELSETSDFDYMVKPFYSTGSEKELTHPIMPFYSTDSDFFDEKLIK